MTMTMEMTVAWLRQRLRLCLKVQVENELDFLPETLRFVPERSVIRGACFALFIVRYRRIDHITSAGRTTLSICKKVVNNTHIKTV